MFQVWALGHYFLLGERFFQVLKYYSVILIVATIVELMQIFIARYYLVQASGNV
jgi:hypothetical protein